MQEKMTLPEHRKTLICSRVKELIPWEDVPKACKLLRTSHHSIVPWLYGYCHPNLPAMLAMHVTYGVSLDWLLGLSDRPGLAPGNFAIVQWQRYSHGLKKLSDGYLEVFRRRLQKLSEGISAEDFAETICVPVDTLNSWKYRGNAPSAVATIMICESLDVSANWLFGLVPEEEGPQ